MSLSSRKQELLVRESSEENIHMVVVVPTKNRCIRMRVSFKYLNEQINNKTAICLHVRDTFVAHTFYHASEIMSDKWPTGTE